MSQVIAVSSSSRSLNPHHRMNELPKEIRSFLRQHPTLGLVEGNKVRCRLTGHELPCRLPELQIYTSGKKYLRLIRTTKIFDYSEFEPHIVPSTKNPHQLFCKLTLRHINKVPEHVLRHVQGRRYQRALKRYEECQAEGVEYVPICLLQKKKRPPRREEPFAGGQAHSKKGEMWEPGSGEEEEDSDDSLSDLYPAELFSERGHGASVKGKDHPKQSERKETGTMKEGDNDTSSEQDAGMDVERLPATKRHQKQTGSLKKKFKSHHRKPKGFKQTVNGK